MELYFKKKCNFSLTYRSRWINRCLLFIERVVIQKQETSSNLLVDSINNGFKISIFFLMINYSLTISGKSSSHEENNLYPMENTIGPINIPINLSMTKPPNTQWKITSIGTKSSFS